MKSQLALLVRSFIVTQNEHARLWIWSPNDEPLSADPLLEPFARRGLFEYKRFDAKQQASLTDIAGLANVTGIGVADDKVCVITIAQPLMRLTALPSPRR